VQGGFTATGRSKGRKNLSGKDCKVDCGNHLNAPTLRVLVEFLELARFDDRHRRRVNGARERRYYRSTARQPHPTARLSEEPPSDYEIKKAEC